MRLAVLAAALAFGASWLPVRYSSSALTAVARAPDCEEGWNVVENPSPGFDTLYSIEAIASDDIWAFGTTISGVGRALAEHWNGNEWTVVDSVSPGQHGHLFNASALSSDDVWAVGNFINNTANTQSFISHWDGTEWELVPNPRLSQLRLPFW